MHVERLLQINTATLAALGTLLLGMGQRNTAVPLFVVAVAAIAIWVTDVQGRLYLTRGAAGLLQVAGLAVTLVWLPLRGLHKDMLILSLAQLLIYWQVVVLFQKKDTRTYWYQTQLSLLQVVVAALLTQGFFFGAMLIVYLMTALSALTLIFLHEERNRYQRAESRLSDPWTARDGLWPARKRPSPAR